MPLRTTFTDIEGNHRQAHADDHLALHLRYNNTAHLVTPGTAAENVAAIHQAITDVTIDRGSSLKLGGTIVIGPGDWELSDTIEIRNVWGLRLLGCGAATRFVWKGASDKPMFKMPHCRDVEMGNFMMTFPQAARVGIFMLRDNAFDNRIVPVHNHFHDIYLDCGSRVQYGIALGIVNEAGDGNNDFMYFENIEVANYKEVGVLLPLSQSYNNMFVNCRLLGDGVNSEYGVKTGELLCGTFRWSGGFVGLNTLADFNLGRAYNPYLIEFVNSEGSARFLVTSHSFNQIVIKGCRFAANELHEDNQVIVMGTNNYNLTIENNSFGDGANPTRDLQFNFWFPSEAAYNLSGITFHNNRVYSAAESVWAGYTPHSLIGNTKITDEQTLASERLT